MKQGWEIKRLGDAMHIARGGSPRPIKKYITDDPNGINWIKIGDASDSSKYIYKTKEKINKDGLHKTRFVEEGDFLLSNSMSFGRPYIMKTTGCIHDGWLVLKENNTTMLDKDFLYHLLCSPYIFEQFDRLAAGSTVRNLNIALVSSVEIPIPPLDEQKRIVAKLDECFEAIDKARANVEKNLNNAKELFQSQLNQIFSQKGDGWIEKKLGEMTKDGSPITYGVVKPGSEGDVLFIRGGDLQNGEVLIHKLRTISDRVSNTYKRTLLLGGELLVCLVGMPGQTAVVPKSLSGANIARQVGLVRLMEKYNPYFYSYYLRTSNGRDALGLKESGSVQRVINLKALKEIEVLCPPYETQIELLNKINSLDKNIKVLESNYQQELDALNELKKSILQKAFNGEL